MHIPGGKQKMTSLAQNGLLPYLACLAAGLFISTLTGFASARNLNLKRKTMPVCLTLALPLALFCARVFYFLVQISYVYSTYGFSFLWSPLLKGYAFTGALLGGWLSGLLCARLTKQSAASVLDAVTPAGMLMIAAARFGEYFMHFGDGSYIENEALHFFPLAVKNEYGEWYLAVFVLEAFFALFICLYTLVHGFPKSGDRVRAALLLICVSQVMLESLRAESIRWGFVRVQQLSCVLIAFIVLIESIFRRYKGGMRLVYTFAHIGIFVICTGVCIGVEFVLDKTDIPAAASYTAMALSLIIMAAAALRMIIDEPKKEGRLSST